MHGVVYALTDYHSLGMVAAVPAQLRWPAGVHGCHEGPCLMEEHETLKVPHGREGRAAYETPAQKSSPPAQDWTERVWARAHPRSPPPRLFTVGRLDVATTGLIFVTNDGADSPVVFLLRQCFSMPARARFGPLSLFGPYCSVEPRHAHFPY